jgi:hypothetical protein
VSGLLRRPRRVAVLNSAISASSALYVVIS